MAEIVIIGGHGKVALALAALLSARGDTVRSIIRNLDQAVDVAEAGATPVLLDIESVGADELAPVLAGADAVVFSAGAGGGNSPRTYAVDRDAAIASMAAAEQAGVKRYVMVSYLGAGPDHGVPEGDSFYPYAEAKAAADAVLRASSLDWTILMPGRLTDDEPTGKVAPKAVRSSKNPGTSRGNVAAVAAYVLTKPSTIGKDLPFTDGTFTISKAIR